MNRTQRWMAATAASVLLLALVLSIVARRGALPTAGLWTPVDPGSSPASLTSDEVEPRATSPETRTALIEQRTRLELRGPSGESLAGLAVVVRAEKDGEPVVRVLDETSSIPGLLASGDLRVEITGFAPEELEARFPGSHRTIALEDTSDLPPGGLLGPLGQPLGLATVIGVLPRRAGEGELTVDVGALDAEGRATVWCSDSLEALHVVHPVTGERLLTVDL